MTIIKSFSKWSHCRKCWWIPLSTVSPCCVLNCRVLEHVEHIQIHVVDVGVLFSKSENYGCIVDIAKNSFFSFVGAELSCVLIYYVRSVWFAWLVWCITWLRKGASTTLNRIKNTPPPLKNIRPERELTDEQRSVSVRRRSRIFNSWRWTSTGLYIRLGRMSTMLSCTKRMVNPQSWDLYSLLVAMCRKYYSFISYSISFGELLRLCLSYNVVSSMICVCVCASTELVRSVVSMPALDRRRML